MENKKDKENEFNFEQFMAAALLKFDSIDNVDLFLLVSDFCSKSGMSIDKAGIKVVPNLYQYVTRDENGVYGINNYFSLDSIIKSEGITLREYLEKLSAGPVYDYFNNLDLEKYRMEKEQILLHNKDNVIKNANVLLISDRQEDYDELVKYGFKNIDCFKSIIRADKYFKEHPEELEKYHITLIGNQSIVNNGFYCDSNLEITLINLAASKKIVNSKFFVYETCYVNADKEIVAFFSDYESDSHWEERERSYSGFCDKIVENALINDVFSRVSTDSKFIAHNDYINPERLALPSKKGDLKILYLGTSVNKEQVENICKQLGINIVFEEDNNYALGKYVKENLGDYDIIITRSIFSSGILSIDAECAEQCKDTGRELTLLVTYSDNGIGNDVGGMTYGEGNLITLDYKFAGNYSNSSRRYSKKFRVIRENVDIGNNEVDEMRKKYFETWYSNMRAILEASINVYDDYIQEINQGKIEDSDLRNADYIDKEYTEIEAKEKACVEAELIPIHAFDEIKYYVFEYLDKVNEGLIDSPPQGLRIYEDEDGAIIEVTTGDGRVLCSLKFKREHSDMRTFGIRTLSNKGKLSPFQTVGVYMSAYNNKEGIPNRPDEKQLSTLFVLQDKIRNNLKPVIDDAYEKRRMQYEEMKKPYKKNRRRNNNNRK